MQHLEAIVARNTKAVRDASKYGRQHAANAWEWSNRADAAAAAGACTRSDALDRRAEAENARAVKLGA